MARKTPRRRILPLWLQAYTWGGELVLAATATDDTAVTTETTTEAEAGVEDATAVEAVVDSVKDAVRTDPTLKFVTEQLNAANADLLNTKLALSKLEDKHAEMLSHGGSTEGHRGQGSQQHAYRYGRLRRLDGGCLPRRCSPTTRQSPTVSPRSTPWVV